MTELYDKSIPESSHDAVLCHNKLMFSNQRNKLILLALIAVIAGWITLLAFISPEEIITHIGVTNAYIAIFLLAAIGGLSSITGTSLFAAVATFAAGGADPWLLGLMAGVGIFISDSIFFLIARKGSQTIETRPDGIRERLAHRIERMPTWGVRAGVFAYVGLTPLPNDILMIALAVARVRYQIIAPALFIGSITIATLTAHLGEAWPW